MFKHGAHKFTLAITLFVLVGSALHAQPSTPPTTATTTASPDGVTGGDPEPTSPNIIEIILEVLL